MPDVSQRRPIEYSEYLHTGSQAQSLIDCSRAASVNTAVMVAVLSVAVVAVLGVARAVVHGRHRPRGANDGVTRGASQDSNRCVPTDPDVAELLSDFEVSRAIGVSVEGVPAPGVRPRPGRSETAYHPLRGGERLLQASVLVGRAGRAALRAYRRRGRPLSHAGDRAYSGDGWVLGQRGDVVVLLRQHDPERWRVIGGLPWLLSTALNRVPSPTAGLNRA
jgi:hypothetical protein